MFINNGQFWGTPLKGLHRTAEGEQTQVDDDDHDDDHDDVSIKHPGLPYGYAMRL